MATPAQARAIAAARAARDSRRQDNGHPPRLGDPEVLMAALPDAPAKRGHGAASTRFIRVEGGRVVRSDEVSSRTRMPPPFDRDGAGRWV